MAGAINPCLGKEDLGSASLCPPQHSTYSADLHGELTFVCCIYIFYLYN